MQAKVQLPVDIRAQLAMINTQESKHVYAINTTENVRPAKGSVSFAAHNQFGEKITIFMPNTYIPIDLAEEVQKEELLQSPDLLRMLRQGMLTLISDNEAEEALSHPRAMQESQKLYNEKYGGGSVEETAASRRFAVTGSQPEVDPNLPTLRGGQGVVRGGSDDPYENVTPMVREAMERADLSDADRYNMIINNAHALTNVDLQYIMNMTNDNDLRQFCSDTNFSRNRS